MIYPTDEWYNTHRLHKIHFLTLLQFEPNKTSEKLSNAHSIKAQWTLRNKSKAILTGLQRISKASVTDPSTEAGNKSSQVY